MKTSAAVLACLLSLFGLSGALAATEETLTFEPFGTVTVYHQSPRPAHVVLFISGDGGWKLGVVDMARELAGMDTLVAGVNITRYMKTALAAVTAANASKDACFNPAEDFEALGRFVEKKMGYASHVPPILVGYSSGATLAYAALVQAPPRTFKGAVSLGFCPDLIVNAPICKGNGLAWKHDPHGLGVDFLPSEGLEVPWIALQGDIDQICTPTDTRTYVGKVPHGELVWLHKVGHGFSVPKNWMRQFKESVARVAAGEAREGSAPSGNRGSAPRRGRASPRTSRP
ncbi:MAG TPA: AcvB/VirJ family lysyl-phosphatidylglycerol hydrolase [Thermoanaerobaculia bacterium]|nr:AcvB/VirJ family lysyl-phosphatidylglycerol hydrolase [Thermoanaerobaculia bacterium]